MNNDKQVVWTVQGLKYDHKTKMPMTKPEDIPVVESGNGVTMSDGKDIFGMSVDANLAIYYIRQLWLEIDKLRPKELAQKISENLELLKDKIDEKEFFTVQSSEILQQAVEAQKWLIALLDHSAAITMDKGLILKMLSQSECEGIRFYLSMKNAPESIGQTEKSSVEFLKERLTLVAVGVDIEGNDLLYKYEDGRPQSKAGDPFPDVETFSLCEEYPYQSGKLLDKEFDSKDLKPYVLYKYAKQA